MDLKLVGKSGTSSKQLPIFMKMRAFKVAHQSICTHIWGFFDTEQHGVSIA
jgi:hypothetical protein